MNMNEYVSKIVKNSLSDTEKLKRLEDLSNDIEIAKNIVRGKFRYCEKCDDYYLSKSFFPNIKTINERVCVYEDPINSGGNDYENKDVEYHYLICPKGHEIVQNRRVL